MENLKIKAKGGKKKEKRNAGRMRGEKDRKKRIRR